MRSIRVTVWGKDRKVLEERTFSLEPASESNEEYVAASIPGLIILAIRYLAQLGPY